MTLIKASSSLRNNYKEISNLSHTTGKPIHITLNGEGDTVLLSSEVYEQIEEKLALLALYENLGVDVIEKIAEAEMQHMSGAQLTPHDTVMDEMRRIISDSHMEAK